MNEMKPPESACVGKGFIPEIQNGSVVLDPLKAIIEDEIGSLTQLERHGRFTGAILPCKEILHTASDPSCPSEKDSQGQKRQQRSPVFLGYGISALKRIVLVATESRAGVVIDVVSDEGNPICKAESLYRFEKKRISGARPGMPAERNVPSRMQAWLKASRMIVVSLSQRDTSVPSIAW